MYTDTTPDRISSVLCHVTDGKERPVLYHSQLLSPSQQGYAYIDRSILGSWQASRHFIIFSMAGNFYWFLVTYHIRIC